MPGVHVCPVHYRPLSDSIVPYHAENKHEYVPALSDNHREITCANRYTDRVLEQLVEIAQDCSWIIDQSLGGHEFCWFEERYSSMLASKGLLTPKGFVHQNSFHEEFSCYFDNETLSILHSNLDKDQEVTWLMSLTQKHRKVFHPIRHILLTRFLAGSVQKLFESNVVYRPFGEAPWPCLNPVANHYLEPMVQEVEITRCSSTGRPVGTFTCSCGFMYSRRGPDSSARDKIRVGRIKIFGPVWETRLVKVLEKDKVGLREAARQMRCDPKTVGKFAHKMGLTIGVGQSDIIDEGNAPKDKHESERKKRRAIWLDAINNYPESSVTQIRRLFEGAYTWLYRNDKEWLKEYSPKNKRNRLDKTRIDWDSRDEEILKGVKPVVSMLYTMNDKPIRITIGRVASMIGMKALLGKHLDKLPKTKSFLLSVVETSDTYRRRRISWAAQRISESGEEVESWKIVRMAGIRAEFLNELKTHIDQQVINYSPIKYSEGGDNHGSFAIKAMAICKR